MTFSEKLLSISADGTVLDKALDICMSGGAVGSDLQFGMCAGWAGHHVIHFSFPGHRTEAPEAELVRLTDDQLREADPFLIRANERVKRYLSWHKPWLINLLRRNYYQVRWSESVYAVGTLDRHGNINGGVGWAVQMFWDMSRTHIYLFEQGREEWLTWTLGEWVPINPPPPHGIYAGIGTRKLNPAGKRAIRALYDYKPQE